MISDKRKSIYLRGLERVLDGDGFYRFTPKQRKRHSKKWKRETFKGGTA
jgi:hypothetical protein